MVPPDVIGVVSAEQRRQLIERACQVSHHAHAPYSKFQVGASLLTSDGKFFDGVNVENASYGLTLCAERSAVVAAVSTGARKFLAMAVASPGGVSPCGACRQFLAEFHPALPLLLVDAENPAEVMEDSLDRLLPGPFRLTDHRT